MPFPTLQEKSVACNLVRSFWVHPAVGAVKDQLSAARKVELAACRDAGSKYAGLPD